MYRSLPYFGGLIIFTCVILSWSALANTFFGTARTLHNLVDHHDRVYFDHDMGTATWTMIIVLNTANWPDPIIPIYELNSNYFMFFFCYCVVVDWGFMNLVLGLVVAFFEQSWEKSKKGQEGSSKGIQGGGDDRQLLKEKTVVYSTGNPISKAALSDGEERARSEVGVEMGVYSSWGGEVSMDTGNPVHAKAAQAEKEKKPGSESIKEEEGEVGEQKKEDDIPRASSESTSSEAPSTRGRSNTRSMAPYGPVFLKMQQVVHSPYFDVTSDVILGVFVLVFIISEHPKRMLQVQIIINSANWLSECCSGNQ